MTLIDASFDGFLPGERAEVPATGSGRLSGTCFALKDLIDLKGFPTGGGNPQWQALEAPAASNAPTVGALLAAGSRCAGKTVTDEFAFSLEGRNLHYGTPLNPRDHAALPGGSSSGSAVAVATGEVDFALGTDTGGSIRVPAAWCGVYGFRPSHGAISADGLLPFAPSLDTIGWFASDAHLLAEIGKVLLPPRPHHPVTSISLVADALDLLEPDLVAHFEFASSLVTNAEPIHLFGVWAAPLLQQTYSTIQGFEIAQGLLPRLDQRQIMLAPDIAARFESTRRITAQDYRNALRVRQGLTDWLAEHCPPGMALVLPSVSHDALDVAVDKTTLGAFYERTLALNAIAGLWGAPHIQLARMSGSGPALSLLSAPGTDHDLLDLANSLRNSLG